MAREELVSSAVTFLQDPSVAQSPVEKRVAFLQSKNLTQEEIDLALSRAGDDPAFVNAPPSSNTGAYFPSQQQAVYRQPPGGQYGSGQYGQWQPQPPPPEVPKRDWRDYFIMATVMGGVSYGLYVVCKRYVAPLISPPTPPQIEQDKASIDEQFTRAFSLLDQLSTDTAALKTAEEQRTERLDVALREVESVVSELKTSARRRDEESRRIGDEVRSLKDGIPKALDGAKETSDKRLKELGTELKSLKMLMANRLGGGTGGTATPPAPAWNSTAPSRPSGANTPTVENEKDEPAAESATAAINTNGTTPAQQPYASMTGGSSAYPSSASRRDGAASPYPLSAGGGAKAAIPAWQMAASKNASRIKPTSFDSGSSTPAGVQPGPQLGEVQRPEDVAASSAS